MVPDNTAGTSTEVTEIVFDIKAPAYYSTIYLDEELVNQNPRSKAAASYHPVMVKDPDAMEMYRALFTTKEIDKAIERGGKNEEDFEGTEYSECDPEIVLLKTMEVIDDMSMATLVKIWILKQFGIVTDETLRRLTYGYERQESTEDG